MKSISASIIVLSGAVCFAAGSLVAHDGTQIFVMLTGGTVALFGLWTWFQTMRIDDYKP